MKNYLKRPVKKVLVFMVIVAVLFTMQPAAFALQVTVKNYAKISYVPNDSEKTFESSAWTKDLVTLYNVKWYEDPTRKVTKGEFMFVELRLLQESLKRRNLKELQPGNVTFNFKDANVLSDSAKQELKILKTYDVLSYSATGYMNLNNTIKKSEAAKVLKILNDKFLKISKKRDAKQFTDIKGSWAEDYINNVYQIGLLNGSSETTFKPDDSITLEQTLQILDNELGYFNVGITREDVAKAMNETFKITLNPDMSSSNYELKMKLYGFDLMYNNKSARSIENVTTLEALKLVITTSYNLYDISGFAGKDEEYEGSSFVKYAKDVGLTNQDIDKNNCSSNVKYIDVIQYFENAKKKLLRNYEVKDATTKLKDFDKYNYDQQLAIKDMMADGIISSSLEELNGNEYITKAKMNELTVNFAEKYNRVAMNKETINTTQEELPSNIQDYPYIQKDISKEIYEIPNLVFDKDDSRTAREIYYYRKVQYYQIRDMVTRYLDTIFNVDYQNLDKTAFKEVLNDVSLMGISDAKYDAYFNYVKTNKIKMESSSKVIIPAIYYDGVVTRVRAIVEYEVTSASKYENLLLFDTDSLTPSVYKSGKVKIVIDVPISQYYNSKQFAVYVQRIGGSIVSK